MEREKLGSWIKSRWLWLPVSLLLIVGLVLVGTILGQAGSAPDPAKEEPLVHPGPEVTDMKEADESDATAGGHPKLASSLNQLLAAYGHDGSSGAQAFAATRGIGLNEGQVHVEILTTAEEIPGLQEAIQASGGEYLGHYEGLMEAMVPIEELVSLAARPEVQIIREPQQAIPMSPM